MPRVLFLQTSQKRLAFFSVGYESETNESELNFSFSVSNTVCNEDHCYILAGKCVNTIKKSAPSKQT